MPKIGNQLTIPALLSRKRKIDLQEAEKSANNQRKTAKTGGSPEVITIDSPDKPSRPDTPEDESPKRVFDSADRLAEATMNRFKRLSCDALERPCPLPEIKWADNKLLWASLLKHGKESKSRRGKEMFERNPEVQPRMRSILLDWLIEVSDVYKLHRETYYLTQDYVDRVLLIRKDTPKQNLQLLGITCLFLAAKVEEIYPPKVQEFAYVTDGACSETAILEHETYVLMELEWKLYPLTATGWLKFYLQLSCHVESSKGKADFEFPRYPAGALPYISKLLDLATLDAGCVNYSYPVLAASAFALSYGKAVAMSTSQLQWKELKDCVCWMAPFYLALTNYTLNTSGSEEASTSTSFEEQLKPDLVPTLTITSDDTHNLQKHNVSMDLLEFAQTIISENARLEEGTPSSSETALQTPSNKPSHQPEITPEGLLTPPASRGKVLSDVTSKATNTNTGLKPTELFAVLTPDT